MMKLEEMLKYDQPTNFIVKNEDYNDNFEIPVLTAGKSFLLGYTNETEGVFYNVPAIIFDDFTTSFHYVDFPFKVKSSAMKLLTPKNGKVHLKYVYYQMIGLKIDTELHKRYWISIFSKLKIPLPSLATQKRIVDILDNATALRDKTKQLLEEYNQLIQSIFLETFGDPVKNLKGWEFQPINNISDKIQIGPFGSQLHQSDYEISGFSLVNPTNIVHGKIHISNCRKINKNKYLSLPNYHLNIGDLILARRGDLSKMALIENENMFCGTGSLYIRFKKSINSSFAYYFLTQESSISKLYEKARGITMANLNKKIIKEFQIPQPPIAIQNQFAEKIALMEQQKELAKQELNESEDLFQALLQKAFKGELVNVEKFEIKLN